MDLTELERFIIAAKRQTYVGGSNFCRSCRLASHDISYVEDAWRYLDSYFGGTDFLDQEVVWHESLPVWAMNYYGRILCPDRIDASRAGATIKLALAALYQEDRFLGSFELATPHGLYRDMSQGTVARFQGHEAILQDDTEVYTLDYHGGLIIP